MRKPKKIAILAAPLLFAAVFAAHAPGADAATRAYAIYSDHTSSCLVDNGGSFFIQGCPPSAADVNHAGLWYVEDTGFADATTHLETYRLRNVHDSAKCLTVSPDQAIIMATCGTNHVQYWEFPNSGGGFQRIRNAHFGNDEIGNGDPPDFVWHFVPTSV